MKLRRIAQLAGLMSVLVLFMVSCYPKQDSVYLDDLDVTLTHYDNQYDFQQNKTFAIRDSVGLVSNFFTEDDKNKFYAPGGANDQILAYTVQKFVEQGYTKVEATEDFDLGVNPVALFVQYSGTVWYPPVYWGGYYGYYGWYGGYYPPYYPYYPWGGGSYYNYSYESGTVMLELATGKSMREYVAFIDGKSDEELENTPADQFPEIDYVWQAFVDGLLGTSGDYNGQRAERGFDEAFEQSPYLKLETP